MSHRKDSPDHVSTLIFNANQIINTARSILVANVIAA